MNDELHMDGNHEVDNLFRDALENFTGSPSDAAWSKLNKKLNYKEVHDFVTFKTPPPKSSYWPTPVYRMQWFRGLVAGTIGAALIASSVLLIKRFDQGTGSIPQNLADSNAIPNRSQQIQNQDQPSALNIVATDEDQPHQTNSNLAEQNGVTSTGNPVTQNLDVQTPDRTGVSTNPRVQDAGREQSPANGNDSQKDNVTPILVTPYAQNQQQTDIDRFTEARQVDSIIRQAIILDSLQQIDEDYNPLVSDSQEGEVNAYNPDQPLVTTDETKPVVANGFTPNGDGLNEYFYIHNLEKYPENVLLIQDRKGTVVLDKKNYTGDWNAAGVPDGTYYYLFSFKDENGQKASIQGIVYIIR